MFLHSIRHPVQLLRNQRYMAYKQHQLCKTLQLKAAQTFDLSLSILLCKLVPRQARPG